MNAARIRSQFWVDRWRQVSVQIGPLRRTVVSYLTCGCKQRFQPFVPPKADAQPTVSQMNSQALLSDVLSPAKTSLSSVRILRAPALETGTPVQSKQTNSLPLGENYDMKLAKLSGARTLPWYLAALAPVAIAGCAGAFVGHFAVVTVALGIFVATLTLGKTNVSASVGADVKVEKIEVV